MSIFRRRFLSISVVFAVLCAALLTGALNRPSVAATTTSTTLNWTSIANSNYRAAEASGGIIDGKFYLFGGYQPSSWTTPTTTASVYDLRTNTWAFLPSMPRGLTHAARVIDRRSFILAGGVASTSNGGQTHGTTDVRRYNIDTRQWTNLPPLPQPRGSASGTLVGRTMHVMGGVDPNKVTKTDHWTLNLDNVNEGWKSAPPMPTPASHFAAVTSASGNSIFVVGGMTGWEGSTVEKNTTYRYDTIRRTWEPRANMPIALSHIGESTVVYDNRIWTFGGEPRFPDLSRDIFVYDIMKNSWVKSTSRLPDWRFSGVAAVQGNVVYHTVGTVLTSAAWKATLPN